MHNNKFAFVYTAKNTYYAYGKLIYKNLIDMWKIVII